jgi:hypothetical protein
MADTVSPVAPSDALLSLVLARTVDLVAARVEIDPVRIEEDAVVRLVADYADPESIHGEALVEAVARRVGSGIGAADIATYVDLGDLAGEISVSDLAGEFDLSDLASNIDVEDVARNIDLAELAREVSDNVLGDVASSVAEHIEAADIAAHIDLSDLAGEVDMSDLAGHLDLDGLVEALDLDEIAARVRRDLPPDLVERVERLEERLALVETVVENETEARLVALEARLAPSAGDLVSVQVGPALPAAPVNASVLDAVIDRTVDALLAALNAAAASGRL